MGGRCYFYDDAGEKEATEFTDNFQISPEKFVSYERDWYSVEQAFQALKLVEKEGFEKIYSEAPNGKNEVQYGNYVWSLGSRIGGFNMKGDWDVTKVKVMFILNLEKYIQHPTAIEELVELTGKARLIGQHSTDSKRHGKRWDFWNGAIQTEIRNSKNIDGLKNLLSEIQGMNGEEVETYLLNSVGA